MTLEQVELERAFLQGWNEVTGLPLPFSPTIARRLRGMTDLAGAAESGREYAKAHFCLDLLLNHLPKQKLNKPDLTERESGRRDPSHGAKLKEASRRLSGRPHLGIF